MESYEQLVGRMYRRFEELAGYSPDDASDLGIRMKVLAGEVYSALATLEYLKGQLSLATASGDSLTALAAAWTHTQAGTKGPGNSALFGQRGPVVQPDHSPGKRMYDCGWSGQFRHHTGGGTGGGQPLCAGSGDSGSKPDGPEMPAPGRLWSWSAKPVGIEQVTNLSPSPAVRREESDEHLRSRLLKALRDPPHSVNAAFIGSFA